MQKNITIRAYKYGNILHYEWSTILLDLTDEYIIVMGKPRRILRHFTKNDQFIIDNWSLEIYYFNKWFTISVDIKDGQVESYYCNIAQPARLQDCVVSFIDLDLDLINTDGSWQVVDQEDFEQNQIRYGYPPDLIEETKLRLYQLQSYIKKSEYPFNGFLDSYITKIIVESKSYG